MSEFDPSRRAFLKFSAAALATLTSPVLFYYLRRRGLEILSPSFAMAELAQPKPHSFLLAAAPHENEYPLCDVNGNNISSYFQIIHFFMRENDWKRDLIQKVINDSKVPLLTIDPAVDNNVFQFQHDTGRFLQNLTPLLNWLGQTSAPIMLRVWYEFNDRWTVYGPQVNTSDDFIKAWRQFQQTVKAYAPNVYTVWSPNVGLPFSQAYPGNEFVDVIGLDGYNKFRDQPEEARSLPDMSFEATFDHDIALAQRLSVNKRPVFVVETNTARRGDFRSQWFDAGLKTAPFWKNVKGLGGFFWQKENQGPYEADWDITKNSTEWSDFVKAVENNPWVYPAGKSVTAQVFRELMKVNLSLF